MLKGEVKVPRDKSQGYQGLQRSGRGLEEIMSKESRDKGKAYFAAEQLEQVTEGPPIVGTRT